jgi:K+ potassium transporter
LLYLPFNPKVPLGIGKAFGPTMGLWFLAIAVLGILGIARHPAVLAALNPIYGLRYLFSNGYASFLVLGGVFLCVTGAEALYADMGHFGSRPIRFAWSGIVLPSLLLNYAGQSAIVLEGTPTTDNIFYRLVAIVFAVIGLLCSTLSLQALDVINALPKYRENIRARSETIQKGPPGPLNLAFPNIDALITDLGKVTASAGDAEKPAVSKVPEESTPGTPRTVIVPFLGEGDEVVGRVIARLLAAKGINADLLSWRLLVAEKVKHLKELKVPWILLSAIESRSVVTIGRMAQSIKLGLPDALILVGLWSLPTEGAARLVKRIKESSGSDVYTNIDEAVLAIAALAHPPEDELKPENQGVQK